MTTFFKNRFVRWVLLPIAFIFAVRWGLHNLMTCTFRYKLTAEVTTPEGVKSGSSVLEVNYQRGADWGGGPHTYDSVQGEATYVDLGGGKNLFVTLGTLDSGRKDEGTDHILHLERILDEPSDYLTMKGALDPIWLPIKIFRLGRTLGQEWEICHRVDEFYGKPAEPIPLNNLPTLVTFSDMRQPDTAKTVDPNDLEATFGPGYSLSAKLEITTDSLTPKIYKVVPWTGFRDPNPNRPNVNRLTWRPFYKLDQSTEASYILH